MAIFAVLAEKADPALGKKVAEKYPKDSYELTPSQWLVAADTIPRQLADELDIREGRHGKAIVIRVSGSSSGWHKKTFWEWLNQKADKA